MPAGQNSQHRPTAIEKRIKRHVLGKTRSFFAATPPGIERICFNELKSLDVSADDAEITKGGIEFSGRVHDCYLANLRLRIANRILMRITAFKATNFRQLAKKAEALPWELYLHKNAAYAFNVTSRHSRLFHTDAVADHFKESVEKRFKSEDLKSEKTINADFPQQIFVRAENDAFTVSIDSSGDLLHKRGLKKQGGRAPIRETIAAAVLTLAGYRAGDILIDPMCGTGTFSLEGAMIANNIPAGWYRDFAFMGWPCFKPARWNHIRREAEKRISKKKNPVVFASDNDQAVCRAFEQVVQKNNLSETVSVCKKDFFDLAPVDIKGHMQTGKKGLVVINPPYGRRLGSKQNSVRLFARICEKLQNDFRGWNIALIAPDKKTASTVPFSVSAHHLFHGGLKLTLLTGKIQ